MDFMNDGDDGFSDPPNTLKSRGSNYLRWDDDHGWRDRDGVPPKGALIVVRIGECIMRWAEKQQTLITHKPLPDIDELNKAVPTKEWSVGFSGQPEPPYKAAVLPTSNHETVRIFPISISFRCSVCSADLLIARIAAALATA